MSEPPVVAFLSHSAQLSGAELFVLRVTAAAREIRPLVVLGEPGPLEAALDDLGVDVVVVPLAAAVRSHTGQSAAGVAAVLRKGTGVIRVAARLAALFRRHGVAVVTTHSAKAHLYGGVAGRLAGIPVVAHLHAVLGTADVRARNAALLRAVVTTLPTAVIANSRGTAASLRLRSSGTVEVVGCPVVVPTEVPAPPGGPVFTVVGRLSPFKGQDLVLRAFATIVREGDVSGARLRLVGGALFERDIAFEQHLRTLAQDLSVADRVDFVGHVDDVVGEFARCDVAVHGSVLEEGFGQVVVEAMAAGRPVVASAAGGPSEIITHGVDGLLVTPGDLDALTSAMRRTALDGALRTRLGVAGRRRAASFALPVIVEQLERALLSVRR